MQYAQKYEGFVLHDADCMQKQRHLLVYFLTGNPGLIHFYKDYLTTVFNRSNQMFEKGPGTSVHIYGCSLAGFETDTTRNPEFVAKHGSGPYDVDQEVDFIDQAMDDAYQDLERCLDAASTPRDIRVVVIGHSLGTYMTLELLRHRKAVTNSPASIIGAILVFPTIMNLASSPSGKKLGYIGSLRYTATVVAAFAKFLAWIPPSPQILSLFQRITGKPLDAVATVTRFLQSPTGVLQALTLLRYELRDISTDKWDDEMWGAVATRSKIKTKLVLYFAEEDHWVGPQTRDSIIAARAASGKTGDEDRPIMEIDTAGVTHDFCIEHSEIVADKTTGYLRRIVDDNWQ